MLVMDYMDSMMVSPVYQQYQVDVAAGRGADWKLIPSKFVLKDGVGGKGGDASLPAAYSLIEAGYGTTMKDQGSDGDCWAFATTTAIESNLKKTKGITAEVSPKQLDYLLASNGSTTGSGSPYYDYLAELGFRRNLGEGGSFLIASFPLSGQYAPVTESRFFAKLQANDASLASYTSWRHFEDVNALSIMFGEDVAAYSKPMAKASLLEGSDYVVTDYRMIFGDQDNVGTVKESIYNYGAVYVGTTAPEVEGCWDEATDTIVDRGTICGNANGHAMTIVGWDDNHAYTDPADGSIKTGAFLLQNSWGSDTIFSDYGLSVDRIMEMVDTSDMTEAEIAELRAEVEEFVANYTAPEYIWLGYDFEDSTLMGTIDFASIRSTEVNGYAHVYDSVGATGMGGDPYSEAVYNFSAGSGEYIEKVALAMRGMVFNEAIDYVVEVDAGTGYVEVGRVTMPAGESGQVSATATNSVYVEGAFKVRVKGYVGGEQVQFENSDYLDYQTVSVYTTGELPVPDTGGASDDTGVAVPSTGLFTGENGSRLAGVVATVFSLVAAGLGVGIWRSRKHLFHRVKFNKK